MAEILDDDFDYAAYETLTEASVKVRPASAFAAELAAQFEEKQRNLRAVMFSTKLRDVIEFRPGEITVWAGYNGHKKSMFTGQVALDLCVQRERVLMASFEMQPERTLARMCRQANASGRLPRQVVERFAAWTDSRLWMFDHIGRIDPARCVAVCRYFAEEKKGTQVFIDSMMMVCASEESLDEQKQLTTDLVRLAQETNLHVHLIAHCRKPQDDNKPPTKYDLRGSAAISDQAHNVITVWANKPKKAALDRNPHDTKMLDEPDMAVTVEKQRNGEWEGRLSLWFHALSMRFCDDRSSPVEPYRMEAA
jgi:twinkle protein